MTNRPRRLRGLFLLSESGATVPALLHFVFLNWPAKAATSNEIRAEHYATAEYYLHLADVEANLAGQLTMYRRAYPNRPGFAGSGRG
jgi:hypothetical protein